MKARFFSVKMRVTDEGEAMKKNIVFSTISIDHDIPATTKRWSQWRPLVELLKIKSFYVSKLYYFIPPSLRSGLQTLHDDLKQVSPSTEIIPIVIDVKSNFSPRSFSENYLFFDSFFKEFPFNTEEENYYFHFGPGNMFAHSFMLIMLINLRKVPCKIIQLRSSKGVSEKYHSTIQIYDNAINHWISVIGDIELSKNSTKEILTEGIVTKDSRFRQLLHDIEHVATHSNAPILLSGATGTGKTLMARRIYELRRRNGLVTGPFVEVNCASFRGDTAVSALFGHVKGAFTGATTERKGMLSMANGGILFLDEVSELSLDIQALLLKAIEEKTFFPLGADKPTFSNFQLITASNRNLYELVRMGTFRMDLIARINLWHFQFPPLGERLEDIEPNINYELKRLSEQTGIFADFLPEAKNAYLKFACSPSALWPGNFRTLSSSIERMHTYAFQGIIDMPIVEKEIQHLTKLWNSRKEWQEQEEFPLVAKFQKMIDRDLDLFEKVQLDKVLEICLQSDNRSEAGKRLFALSRLRKTSSDDTTRLNKYLKSYNLDWKTIKNN